MTLPGDNAIARAARMQTFNTVTQEWEDVTGLDGAVTVTQIGLVEEDFDDIQFSADWVNTATVLTYLFNATAVAVLTITWETSARDFPVRIQRT